MEKAFLLLSLATLICALNENKRVLPTNKNCDPSVQICKKGDWINEDVADCKYDRFGSHFFSCDAQNDHIFSWTVDTAVGDRCIPASGKRFACGAPGTNTRCVCSDTNPLDLEINACKCQYWPPEDVGAHSPAFCTGYYMGGTSGISGHGVHHWACCNNCNDPTPNTCEATTWQGGSSISYCGPCGQNTGGGQVEYYFNCGNCDDQRYCSNFCDDLGLDIILLCWRWLECFRGCCLNKATQPRNKRDISEHSFCGDTICSGNETPSSCPADCCYQVNSNNCTSGSSCSPQCCLAPNCCLNEENNDSGNNQAVAIGVPIGVGILLLIVIIIVAVVCYRKGRHGYHSV